MVEEEEEVVVVVVVSTFERLSSRSLADLCLRRRRLRWRWWRWRWWWVLEEKISERVETLVWRCFRRGLMMMPSSYLSDSY